MSDDTWDALGATPFAEVRRRAAIVDEIVEVAPVTVDGALRFGWNDGGGQSAVWYFTEDGRGLLLTFDHESALNLYAEGGYALQRSFYDGVPEDLVRLVCNRPENYESLNLRDPETKDTIHYAGGVFWYDGTEWRVAEGVAGYCRRRKLELFDESGFDYCLQDYRFGRDFTPEGVIEDRAAEGWYADEPEREAELATVREIFARHP